MFDTVCTLPLEDDLFAQAIHPNAPVLAVGLSTGHVESYRLPPVGGSDASSDDDGASTASHSGRGQIETAWRTRRHKGSCRSLAYSLDGSVLFSTGTDGIVKIADSESGKVADKIAIPLDPSSTNVDQPSLLHILSPQTCLLATDSSALHLYDLRVSTKGQSGSGFVKRKPQQTHYPHTDYISSLTPLPPTEASTSGYSKQWVSTGGTTLAVTDLRRGVLVKSEDQEEELLSSVFVSGLSKKGGGTSTGQKVVVGGAAGVLTLWEKGQWDDQDERIVVDRGDPVSGAIGESLDCLELLPEGVGPGGKIIAVGMGDGNIKFVRMNENRVIDGVRHDDVEGVIGLGFDVEGRMISGGGTTIKVWHDKVDEDNHGYVKGTGSDSDDDEDAADGPDASDSSDEEPEPRPTKKRKGASGNHLPGGGTYSFSGLD